MKRGEKTKKVTLDCILSSQNTIKGHRLFLISNIFCTSLSAVCLMFLLTMFFEFSWNIRRILINGVSPSAFRYCRVWFECLIDLIGIYLKETTI